jgi:hypothetical protein
MLILYSKKRYYAKNKEKITTRKRELYNERVGNTKEGDE